VRKTAFLLSVFITVSMSFAFAADQNPRDMNGGRPALVPDEVIVKFDPSVADAKKNEIKVRYDLEKKKDSYKKGAFTVYRHRNPQAILSRLKHEAGVIYAEQNGYVYAVMTPGDPLYSPYQWNMTRIGMEDAWDESTGEGAIVAIIDSGVKQGLEDLAGTSFIGGYDFVNNDNDPTDDAGHGSHVCGTVAQSTDNGIGVAGIAYDSTIMPVKVLDSRGRGTWDDVADGIEYATDNGADVINLSLGGTAASVTLEDAVNYAWGDGENGVVVVCAAGNNGSNAPHYPAYYSNCIAVSATNYLDEKADYSNYGSWVDISAPGGDSNDNNGDGYIDGILQNTFSRRSGDGYYFYTGTSMASPHVAGVAALVKACDPSLTNTQIRNILETTAEDNGTSGRDDYFGYGIVDAHAAALRAYAYGGGNQRPVADFIYDVNDLTVDFTDTSRDPDGSIVAWEWDFGDSFTSTARNPRHTYTDSATYYVTLTATDEEGATGSVTRGITIGAIPDIYVSDIAMGITRAGRNYTATADITIMDTNDNVVPDATVFVDWSGVVSGSASGVTGAAGTVTFNSAKVKSTGPFTIRVTNVTHATMDYDSALNDETSDSITFDPVTR
jgi:serine protease